MADAARFNWEDPLLLDQQLNDEERMIRDAAHAYAQDKLRRACSTRFATNTPTSRSFAKWANSACSARRFPSSTAAPA